MAVATTCVLLVYHKTGCPACEPLVGPEGTLSKLVRVDVLEVEASHPFSAESEGKWGVPIEFYPTLVLACPWGAFAYPRDADRTIGTLQAWVDGKLSAGGASCSESPA